jgi:hypothetical protein
MVADLKTLAPHTCIFRTIQGLSRIFPYKEVIQLAYRKLVVLLRFLFVQEIMHTGHLRFSSTS